MKFATMYRDYIARLDGMYRADREAAAALWDKIESLTNDLQKVRENKMLSDVGKRANIESLETALTAAKKKAETFFSDTARKWAEMSAGISREPWARRYAMNPAEIDGNLLAVLNSGLCTADELETLADEYDSNYTMRRFLADALRKEAANHEETRRAAMLARAAELDGGKPAEVQAAENLISLIQSGLRSNRTVSDGVNGALYSGAYEAAANLADSITGETTTAKQNTVTSAGV